ncbi:recombinase family protein [Caballeronia jiangsuensis]
MAQVIITRAIQSRAPTLCRMMLLGTPKETLYILKVQVLVFPNHMKNARVFSYLRFSDVRQKAGTSIAHQQEYAAKWAADHGLTLDTSLNLRDEGLSAYHLKNVTKGALGTFFKAIDSGRVPSGSVLVVESHDRLSRAEVDVALAQLLNIIHSGITVVTANDGQVYSREQIKDKPWSLMYSMIEMMRAHQESDIKSKRVKASLRLQCEGWLKGTWRGHIAVGKDPKWIRFDRNRNQFELVGEYAESLRALIGFYRAGHSPSRSFERMREAGIALPPCVSNVPRLHAILANRNLVGEKTIKVEGETYLLPGYYPALLTEAEFASLQYLRAQRGRRVGRAEVISFMTGLGITFCARCGYAMGNQNIMSRPKRADGLPHEGHRRLVCTGAQKAADRCTVGSCSIVPVERALMAFCSDQLNLASLFVEDHEKTRQLNSALALARQQVDQTADEVRTYLGVKAIGGASTPAMILEHMTRLSPRLDQEKSRVTALEHDLEALHRHCTPAVSEVWGALREGVDRLDEVARTKARQLIADTFARIEVSLQDRGMIGLRLVSKRDIVRILWIDRKTGERRDQLTVENTHHTALAKERRGRKRAA